MRNYVCNEHEDRLADMLADDITLPENFWTLTEKEQLAWLYVKAESFMERIDDLIDKGINVFDLY